MSQLRAAQIQMAEDARVAAQPIPSTPASAAANTGQLERRMAITG